MSELRKYLLSNDLVISEGDQNVAKGGFSRFSFYPEDLNKWYLQSEYFKNLTQAEKVLAYSALVKTSGIWHVGLAMDDGEDKLFAFDSAAQIIPADEYDAEVLSGALGADLVDYAKEFAEEQDNESGIETYDLNRLVMIGALSRSRESFLSVGAVITIEESDGTERQIGIGGDLHGDFCMVETIGHKGFSIAPNGVTVPFSPLEPNFIYGYHSVELDITEILLRHATNDSTSEERAAYLDEIINAGDPIETSYRTGAFGDYGTALEHRFWIMDENANLRDGSTVESFMVKPGSQDIRFEVRSLPDGVLFAQTQKTESDNSTHRDIANIFLPDAAIPKFLNALRVSNMGRVAPIEIEQLARMMLLDDKQHD